MGACQLCARDTGTGAGAGSSGTDTGGGDTGTGGSSTPPAPQSITISGTVTHDVCGNGDASNDGSPPCAGLTSGNTVTVASSGQVQGSVYGAFNYTDTNAVTGNQVLVNGTVGAAEVMGGYHVLSTGDVTASGNSVTIGSGAVVLAVYGGFAETGNGSATASNNTVLIDGGTGGEFAMAIVGGAPESNTGAVTATGNTVTIQNVPLYTTLSQLWGELWGTAVTPASTDNNTLNLHAAGLSVPMLGMGGFQNLNFFLPASLAAVGTLPSVGQDCTGLSVGSTADQTDTMLFNGASSNLGTDTVVNVSLDGAGPPLHTGDQFVLIRSFVLNGNGFPTITGNIAAGSETGVIGGYKYTLALVQQGGTNTCGDLMLTIGAPAS